jgi:hypothetical protein
VGNKLLYKKKKAIRKAIKKTYLSLVRIKKSNAPDFVKYALMMSTVAQMNRHIDLIKQHNPQFQSGGMIIKSGGNNGLR